MSFDSVGGVMNSRLSMYTNEDFDSELRFDMEKKPEASKVMELSSSNVISQLADDEDDDKPLEVDLLTLKKKMKDIIDVLFSLEIVNQMFDDIEFIKAVHKGEESKDEVKRVQSKLVKAVRERDIQAMHDHVVRGLKRDVIRQGKRKAPKPSVVRWIIGSSVSALLEHMNEDTVSSIISSAIGFSVASIEASVEEFNSMATAACKQGKIIGKPVLPMVDFFTKMGRSVLYLKHTTERVVRILVQYSIKKTHEVILNGDTKKLLQLKYADLRKILKDQISFNYFFIVDGSFLISEIDKLIFFDLSTASSFLPAVIKIDIAIFVPQIESFEVWVMEALNTKEIILRQLPLVDRTVYFATLQVFGSIPMLCCAEDEIAELLMESSDLSPELIKSVIVKIKPKSEELPISLPEPSQPTLKTQPTQKLSKDLFIEALDTVEVILRLETIPVKIKTFPSPQLLTEKLTDLGNYLEEDLKDVAIVIITKSFLVSNSQHPASANDYVMPMIEICGKKYDLKKTVMKSKHVEMSMQTAEEKGLDLWLKAIADVQMEVTVHYLYELQSTGFLLNKD